ncbi:MAG: hypothetical protein JO218_13470 [Burkholderiales bacterium]|nr:hypothetical protein [Burkholderiales bacterium]
MKQMDFESALLVAGGEEIVPPNENDWGDPIGSPNPFPPTLPIWQIPTPQPAPRPLPGTGSQPVPIPNPLPPHPHPVVPIGARH